MTANVFVFGHFDQNEKRKNRMNWTNVKYYDIYLFFAYNRFATNTMPTGNIVQNVM